ncbi:hypothetical protein JCM11641_000270 [Rhodosporidiobolus odoratus]
MDAPALADPSQMSGQERTDEVVKAIEEDDLLGVLLVLHYAVGDEVNASSSRTGETLLETVLTAPLRRLDVRKLVAECLLHQGANATQALRSRLAAGQAVAAYRLLYSMRLEEAEAWINSSGLSVADLPAPMPSPATGAVKDASYRRRRSPESRVLEPLVAPQNASVTSSRRSRSPPRSTASSHYETDSTRSRSPQRRPRSPLSPSHGGLPLQGRKRALSATSPSLPRRPGDKYARRHEVVTGRRRSPSPRRRSWVFVRGMDRTVSERFLWDQLEARGLNLSDVFLSRSNDGSRFAYLALDDGSAARAAIDSLDGVRINGRPFVAKAFLDPNTGEVEPQVKHGVSGPYLGSQKQADRPASETRCGVTLMHLDHGSKRQDVVDFLRPVILSSEIERIDLTTSGITTFAFCRLYGRDLARKAILELDGKTMLGCAIRVNWMGGDTRPQPNLRRASPPPQRRSSRSGNKPPTEHKTGSLKSAQGNQSRPVAASLPTWKSTAVISSSTSAEPDKVSASTKLNNVKQSTISISTSGRVDDEGRYASDLSQLQASGFSEDEIRQIKKLWKPATTLGANRLEPAFPDDKQKQRLYDAFLAAQTGTSRQYYMDFFRQFAEFNRTTELFAATASSAAEGASKVDKGRRRGS